MSEEANVVVVNPKRSREPDERAAALDTLDNVGKLSEEYGKWEKDKLADEYKHLNIDFDLAMKSQNKLMAIMGILVNKYHITNAEVGELRKIPKSS